MLFLAFFLSFNTHKTYKSIRSYRDKSRPYFDAQLATTTPSTEVQVRSPNKTNNTNAVAETLIPDAITRRRCRESISRHRLTRHDLHDILMSRWCSWRKSIRRSNDRRLRDRVRGSQNPLSKISDKDDGDGASLVPFSCSLRVTGSVIID